MTHQTKPLKNKKNPPESTLPGHSILSHESLGYKSLDKKQNDYRLNLTPTREILNPTVYVKAIHGQYADYVFDEELSVKQRGKWREKVFLSSPSSPLDVEIGTGNGFFFAHQAKKYPNRNLLGLELKFKPLVQAIRRGLKAHCNNVRMVRYDAKFIDDLFLPGEIDNVFVHHPDPWTQRSRLKRRLFQISFLDKIFHLQSHGSFIDLKTDSADYFLWACKNLNESSYRLTRKTTNLHNSPWAAENFVTHFEKIFSQKDLPIYYLRATKPNV